MEIDRTSTVDACLAGGCPPTDATLAAPAQSTTDAPTISTTPKRASSRIARQQEQKAQEKAAAAAAKQQEEEDEEAAAPSEKGGKGKGKGNGKRAAAAAGAVGGGGGSGTGGGKKKAGAGGATTCRLKGLASLPRVNLLLFKAEVLSLLTPVDLVRLMGVCKRYRALFSTDDVWEHWLAKVGEGSRGRLPCLALPCLFCLVVLAFLDPPIIQREL